MRKRRDDTGMVVFTDAVVRVMLIAFTGVAVFMLMSRIIATEADRQAQESREQIAVRWLAAPNPPDGCGPAPSPPPTAPDPPAASTKPVLTGLPALWADTRSPETGRWWIALEWAYPADASILYYETSISPQPPETHTGTGWVRVPGSGPETTAAVAAGFETFTANGGEYVVRLRAVGEHGTSVLRAPGRTRVSGGFQVDEGGPPPPPQGDASPCWLPRLGSVCEARCMSPRTAPGRRWAARRGPDSRSAACGA